MWNQNSIISAIKNHFDRILADGLADTGPDPNAMWLAALDVQTGRYPDFVYDDDHPRIHHYAHSPYGVNAYQDQPHLVAAHLLSEVTGDPRYAAGVQAYLRDFIARSQSYYGLLLWGDHYYYHVTRGEVVQIGLNCPPTSLDTHRVSAFLHDLRPHTPAWGLLWQAGPQVTEKAIRAMGLYHVYDPDAGAFSDMADQQPGPGYLENGAVLVSSLAWLAVRLQDDSLHDLARRVAAYSYSTRNQDTGLLPVALTSRQQWVATTSTTETGVWVRALLQAAQLTENTIFIDMATRALSAWLLYAWDSENQTYFGRLNIHDGTPQYDEEGIRLIHDQPPQHIDIWRAWFPAHDYPLVLAQACVALQQVAPHHDFEVAIHRWAGIVHQALNDVPPVRYAEQIGRAIYFLFSAGRLFPDTPYHMWAAGLADEAVDLLYREWMFRSNTAENHYQAVDGLGYLLVALLALETNMTFDTHGWIF